MLETLPDPSRVGSVVLDIGGDVGAAIVFTPASLAHEEIEIRHVEDLWKGVHVAVRPRILAGGTRHAAVFGSLVEGRYEIRVRHGTAHRSGHDAVQRFDVIGASVTQVEFRS